MTSPKVIILGIFAIGFTIGFYDWFYANIAKKSIGNSTKKRSAKCPLCARLRCGGPFHHFLRPANAELVSGGPFPCPFDGTRYRRGPPTVPNMRAVLKKASSGTRRVFSGTRCSKQASTVRKRYSVPKTGFCGTRRTFKGALNGILSHRTHFQRPAEQPTPQTVDSLLPHWTHFRGVRAKSSTCPPDASLEAAVPKAAHCHTGRIFSARNGSHSLCSLHSRINT